MVLIDRIITLPVRREPQKKSRGNGGAPGPQPGSNIKLGGRWMGQGNNRRFLPYGVYCQHAEDCELCPLPDGCHYKRGEENK